MSTPAISAADLVEDLDLGIFDDDDEDFGAELEDYYGEDEDDVEYDWFGKGEDDDDDDYGADDDDDDDLDDLEDDIDSSFGFKPMVQPEAVDQVAAAVAPGVLLPKAVQGGRTEQLVEWMHRATSGDDPAEIANYITSDPRFVDWGGLSQDEKEDIVATAIKKAAVPGIELSAWDDLEAGWAEGGVTGAAKAGPRAIWSYISQDIPMGLAATVEMLPFVDIVDEEMLNQTAIQYWSASKVGAPIYAWLVESIDANAPEAILPPSQSFDLDEVQSFEFESTEIIDVAPSTSMMPEPQTILAAGYGIMAFLAALGLAS